MLGSPHRGGVYATSSEDITLGHRSYGLIRQSRCLFFPSALASCKKSLQVATSPCCHRDLPDVISANLSSDAWPLATAVPRSAYTCFFPRVIGLPQQRRGSASRLNPRTRLLAEAFFEAADISLCSGLRVCSSPRSFLPLRILPQGSRDFYIRAERASLPPHAPDMLAVRIQAIDGTRTFTLQDSQPCRLLPPVYASSDTSRCLQQDSRSGWIRYFLSCRGLAPPTTCRFIPALSGLPVIRPELRID